MEHCVAGPLVVSNHSYVASGATLKNRPCTLSLAVGSFIEETTVEDRIILHKIRSLLGVLDVSEVAVRADLEAIGFIESTECVVTTNLVELSQLDRTFGQNVAVILDGKYRELKAVKLSEISGHKAGVGVFLFCGS